MPRAGQWAKHKALALFRFFSPKGYFPLWKEVFEGRVHFVVGETLSQLRIQEMNISGIVSVHRATQAEKRALRNEAFLYFETVLRIRAGSLTTLPLPLRPSFFPEALTLQLTSSEQFTIYDKIIAYVQWLMDEWRYYTTQRRIE